MYEPLYKLLTFQNNNYSKIPQCIFTLFRTFVHLMYKPSNIQKEDPEEEGVEEREEGQCRRIRKRRKNRKVEMNNKNKKIKEKI